MSDAAPSQQTVDDLIYHFAYKKRLTNKNWEYTPTIKGEAYFREAAVLCDKHNMTPAEYIQIMYDRMGDRKEFFSSEHIRGGNVQKVLEKVQTGEVTVYTVEMTIHDLDFGDVWDQQRNLAMRYISRGESVESVLMDSSLKFFAWYRILSTPRPYMPVIEKYKHIAQKELTPALLEFVKREKLDIDRII
jgi:hypothetical protein